MSGKTKIEWTDSTWNPLVGCSRVSKGCVNCYAEGIAYRFSKQKDSPFFGTAKMATSGPVWTGKVNLNTKALLQPWNWTRGRRIFVNSMSDLFHESVPFETIALIFFLMSVTTRHTYQVLTKRPQRMLEFFLWALNEGQKVDEPDIVEPFTDLSKAFRILGSQAHNWIDDRIGDSMWHPLLKELGWEWETHDSKFGTLGYDNCGPGWPYENIWLGVSVENQETADERIPLLCDTPAAVRFLSCEPLLGPVDVGLYLTRKHIFGYDPLGGIDWVIVGGESGRGARPMHPEWARAIRDKCAIAGVPYFFKQWGEFGPTPIGHIDDGTGYGHALCDDGQFRNKTGNALSRVGKKAAGNLLDGVEHKAFPEAP